MKLNRVGFITAIVFIAATCTRAAEVTEAQLQAVLSKPILDAGATLAEVQQFCASRVPEVPKSKTSKDWDGSSSQLRTDFLDKIVFRGEAKKWSVAETKVEWLDTIGGGPEYTIRKLRYEAIPGLWIPGLLYQPNNIK